MADITVRLPDEVKEIIEAQVGDDGFATTGDYIAELVRRDNERRLDERDRASRNEDERIEHIRRMIEEAERSGISERTMEDIREEGLRIARERGFL